MTSLQPSQMYTAYVWRDDMVLPQQHTAHLCIPVALFPADSSPRCRFHKMMKLGRTMVIMSSRACMVMNLNVT